MSDLNKEIEDFLKMVHAKLYKGLDDDMPDAYNEWLDQLDTYEWIKLIETFTEIRSKSL